MVTAILVVLGLIFFGVMGYGFTESFNAAMAGPAGYDELKIAQGVFIFGTLCFAAVISIIGRKLAWLE